MTDWPGTEVSEAQQSWPGQTKQAEGEKLPPSEPSTTEEFVKGFVDPGMGAAQLISHVVPGVPSAKADEAVRSREKVPGKKDDDSLSAARFAGNAVNPINYMGPAALAKLAPGVGSAARSVAAGGLAGLLQPTTDENYWRSKTLQGAEGMGLGFGFTMGGKAVSKGMEAVGDYLVRNHPDVLSSKAVQLVLKRMNQDARGGSLSAKDAIDLVEAANASGKPMTLADAGGPNTRGLSGSVFRQGKEGGAIAKTTMDTRDAGTADRLTADINNYVHGGDTAKQTTDLLLKARSSAAAPAYQALDSVKGVWSPRLQEFFGHQEVKDGMKLGYKLERLDSLAEKRPFNPTALGVDLDTEGNILFRDVPNMRVLDMGKRGLDAMIAKERDPLSGRLSSTGLSLDNVRRAYLAEIDSLDTKGLYKKAREAWQGPSASLDALRAGRAVFGQSGEENAAVIGKLSENDKEFYRVGVADMLKERLAKAGIGGDEAKNLIKNEWMRKQLKPVFKEPKDFDAFVDAVATERLMFDARNEITRGSQTAERGMADASAVSDIANARSPGLATGIMHGNWAQILTNAWKLYRDLGARPDPKFNEAVSRILFSPLGPGSDVGKHLMGQAMARPANPQAAFGRALNETGAPMASGAVGGMVGEAPGAGLPELPNMAVR